ncbi:hypothetical protein B0H11DRAFT_1925812 [Mycena galericulata]|nr:hypothetical protein B0H11DRAFT_1925812 [Mycena galericulata]
MSTLLPSLFVAESPSSLTHGALAAASTPRHRPRIIPLARLASGLITVEPAVVRDHVLREDDNRCILITLHGMLGFKKPLGAFAAYTGVKPSSTLAKLIVMRETRAPIKNPYFCSQSFRPNSVYSTSQCRESINDAESDPKISDFIAILPGLSQAPTVIDGVRRRRFPPFFAIFGVAAGSTTVPASESFHASFSSINFKPCMRGGGTKHRTTLKLRVSHAPRFQYGAFTLALVSLDIGMRILSASAANALRGHYKILARTSQHSTTQRAAPTALSPPDENAHDPAHPVAHMPAVEHTRMGVHESHRGDEALGRLPFPSAIARSLPHTRIGVHECHPGHDEVLAVLSIHMREVRMTPGGDVLVRVARGGVDASRGREDRMEDEEDGDEYRMSMRVTRGTGGCGAPPQSLRRRGARGGDGRCAVRRRTSCRATSGGGAARDARVTPTRAPRDNNCGAQARMCGSTPPAPLTSAVESDERSLSRVESPSARSECAGAGAGREVRMKGPSSAPFEDDTGESTPCAWGPGPGYNAWCVGECATDSELADAWHFLEIIWKSRNQAGYQNPSDASAMRRARPMFGFRISCSRERDVRATLFFASILPASCQLSSDFRPSAERIDPSPFNSTCLRRRLDLQRLANPDACRASAGSNPNGTSRKEIKQEGGPRTSEVRRYKVRGPTNVSIAFSDFDPIRIFLRRSSWTRRTRLVGISHKRALQPHQLESRAKLEPRLTGNPLKGGNARYFLVEFLLLVYDLVADFPGRYPGDLGHAQTKPRVQKALGAVFFGPGAALQGARWGSSGTTQRRTSSRSLDESFVYCLRPLPSSMEFVGGDLRRFPKCELRKKKEDGQRGITKDYGQLDEIAYAPMPKFSRLVPGSPFIRTTSRDQGTTSALRCFFSTNGSDSMNPRPYNWCMALRDMLLEAILPRSFEPWQTSGHAGTGRGCAGPRAPHASLGWYQPIADVQYGYCRTHTARREFANGPVCAAGTSAHWGPCTNHRLGPLVPFPWSEWACSSSLAWLRRRFSSKHKFPALSGAWARVANAPQLRNGRALRVYVMHCDCTHDAEHTLQRALLHAPVVHVSMAGAHSLYSGPVSRGEAQRNVRARTATSVRPHPAPGHTKRPARWLRRLGGSSGAATGGDGGSGGGEGVAHGARQPNMCGRSKSRAERGLRVMRADTRKICLVSEGRLQYITVVPASRMCQIRASTNSGKCCLALKKDSH